MIISYSKQFVYIHLEKCGGTSIEYALKPYLNDNDIFISSTSFEDTDLEKYYMKHHNLWKHATAETIKKYLSNEWDQFYKFATVRNPEEIMKSLYYYDSDFFIKNKIKNFRSVEYNENINKIFIIDDKNLITSSTHLVYFAESILDKSGIDGFIKNIILSKDYSVRPQIDRLDSSVNLFDISKINNSWIHILEKTNMPNNTILKFLNKSNRPKEIVLKKSTLDLIHDNFYNDYKNIPKITGVRWN